MAGGTITRITLGNSSTVVKGNFEGFYDNLTMNAGKENRFIAKKTHHGTPKSKENHDINVSFPMLIIQSIGRKGKKNIVNSNGLIQSTSDTALDMLYKDYPENKLGFDKLYNEIYNEVYNKYKQDGKFDILSRTDYAKNKTQKVLSLVKKFCKKYDKELFEIFKRDAKRIFSQGELEENIIRMIEKMQSKEPGEYSHLDLSQAVIEHANTKNFIGNVKKWTRDFLIKNNKNVDILRIRDNSEGIIYHSEFKKKVDKPRFNHFSDRFSGLQIATNDIWAYQIFLKNCFFLKNIPHGTLHFDFYDHFGLDYPDIEKYQNDIFIAWFILQHFRGYPPFITRISFTSKF